MAETAVLFALPREAGPFLRAFPAYRRVEVTPCKIHLCGRDQQVLVLETGVGQKRMVAALDWLLSRGDKRNAPGTLRLVISAGFSGALCEHLQVGDIVIGTEVIGSDGGRYPVTRPAADWRTHLRRGRLLTVDRLIADPAEKQALARQHDAIAVDMETATIGRRCHELGVPFACIRAISDDARATLSPELDDLIVNGRLAYHRMLGGLLRRPSLAAELWRLAKNTRLAAIRLGETLEQLLTTI